MTDLLIAPNSVPASGADLKPSSGIPQYATSGDPTSSIPATVWPAYMANQMMLELYNIVVAAGITPSGNDWAQVWQAILRCDYFIDIGTVNALLVALPSIKNQPSGSGAFNQLSAGTVVRVKVAQTNNSATVTLNAFGTGVKSVIHPDGSAMRPGDLPANQIIEFTYDGLSWRAIGSFTSALLIPLSTNTTFYVATTGNDTTGDGTLSRPWATIQHAYDWVSSNINLNGHTLTIQIQNGTYNTGLTANSPVQGAGNVVINGNNTPSAVVVAVTGSSCMVAAKTGVSFTVQGMTLQATISGGSGGIGIIATNGGNVFYQNVVFGTCSSFQVYAAFGGSTQCIGSITVNGGAQVHIGAYQGSATGGATVPPNPQITYTISGTPAYSIAFALAQAGGSIYIPTTIFSGSATGSRYQVSSNGVIDTGAGGATYLPGNSSGTTATGGQYV